MCEYKAEMKCTWTAESSRMKGGVQLGLLCLSLLISSLHGEVETDSSMEGALNFEEPDLDQPEMYRVRRQTVSREKEDTAKTEVVVTSSGTGKMDKKERKGKRPHPGAFTLLSLGKDSELQVYRTKRQNKSKTKQRSPHRPGRNSLLARVPQPTGHAKMDKNATGKTPCLGC